MVEQMENIKDNLRVDQNLHGKCRLCLEEEGKYQIVPSIQRQFKLCFDIDVEPSDGLSQKVCENCESLLSQFAAAKLIFPERQKRLISNLNSIVSIDNFIQQQQDTVSSTQIDTDNKKKQIEKESLDRAPLTARPSSTETCNSVGKRKIPSPQFNSHKKKWCSDYTKQYVCRYCSKYFKDKKTTHSHIHKKCKLYLKYSKNLKKFCLVGLNSIDSKPNITGTKDYVVCNKKRIIQSRKANYYILYTIKPKQQNDSDSSVDTDFFVNKRRKRRRLISRSSNDTVVIEEENKSSDVEDSIKQDRRDTSPNEKKKTKISSDIECVNIDDSDTASVKSSVQAGDKDPELTVQHVTPTINDKMINSIITMCSKKFMSRLNVSDGETTSKDKEESYLKHKILSIGRKLIHYKGITTTGLLHYMEHKNLEVVWVPKSEAVVTIKTRQKESTDNENNNFGWENLTLAPNCVVEDFVDIFERQLVTFVAPVKLNRKRINNQVGSKQQGKVIGKGKEVKSNAKGFNLDRVQKHVKPTVTNTSNSFPKSKNNPNLPTEQANSKQSDTLNNKKNDNAHLRAALDSEKNWAKLLNANPVANPKQLPRKTNFNEPASIVKVFTEEVAKPAVPSVTEEQSKKDNCNNALHAMPVITSTISLAQGPNEQANNANCSNERSRETRSDNTTQLAVSNANIDSRGLQAIDSRKVRTVDTSRVETIDSSRIKAIDTRRVEAIDTRRVEAVDSRSVQKIDKCIPQASNSSDNQTSNNGILQVTATPKIKVRDVSTLMSNRALGKHSTSIAANTGWSVNNEIQQSNHSVILPNPSTNLVYMSNTPVYMNLNTLQPNIVYYSQPNIETPIYNSKVSTVQQSGFMQSKQNREFVVLHTVELPHTKTDAPLRYLQNLLLLHDIKLLDSLHIVSTTMICLTKFRVVFEQETNMVQVCLFLFCENNTFCIKARDDYDKDMDILSFTPNWQWEMLKIFKGPDVVIKLLTTAVKFGTPVHNVTTCFLNVLKSIVYSKDTK